MPLRVPLAEAKNRLSELMDRATQGEDITITRHNHDVVRLVPTKRPSREAIQRVIDGLNELRSGSTVTTREILAWKNQGRRLPLETLDGRLRAAAAKSGVKCLPATD